MNAWAITARWKRLLLVAAFAAVVALAAGLNSAPSAVVQGWLIAFVFVSGVPIGSVVLLMIHRLTGGRWGEALAPVLMRSAAVMPVVALAFIPLAFDLSAPYSWALDSSGIRPAVAHGYLNEPAFLFRAAIALVGWSVLAFVVVRGRCTPLIAGLGLTFHGFFISLVAVDWILSIDAKFTSSAFAAGIAIQQILFALAFAAIVGPEPRRGPSAGDLGALIIATILGTFYLDLISFIVIWYGNLPDKAGWYLARGRDGWQWVIAAAFVVGALIPFALLLKQSFRRSRAVLRLIGGMVLVGGSLHVLWSTAPAFGTGAIVAAAVAMIALAGLCIGLVDRVALWIRGEMYGA